MNAEHREAAEVDNMIAPKLAPLLSSGGALVARKVSLTDGDDIVLTYIVALPLPLRAVKVELAVGVG